MYENQYLTIYELLGVGGLALLRDYQYVFFYYRTYDVMTFDTISDGDQ